MWTRVKRFSVGLSAGEMKRSGRARANVAAAGPGARSAPRGGVPSPPREPESCAGRGAILRLLRDGSAAWTPRFFLPWMAPGRRRDAPDLAQGCALLRRKEAPGGGKSRDSGERATRAADATRRQGWRHSKQDEPTANRTLKRRPGAGERPRACGGNKACHEANDLECPAC